MYCSTCGGVVAQGLNYCKNCGAKLNQPDRDSSDLKPESLIHAMSAVFVLGMIGIIVLMGVMKVILGVRVETILGLTLLPFAIMLILEGVFISLLLSHYRKPKDTTPPELRTGQVTNELNSPPPRVLPEPVPSVTEQTTRAFEPIPTTRKQTPDHS